MSEIIKRLVGKAKIEHPKEYSAYSLRVGFVTETADNGTTNRPIMRQTDHKSRSIIDRCSCAALWDR